MKKILAATVLLSLGLTWTTSTVEASWLSKAWNRLETSSNNLAKENSLPTHADYNYPHTMGAIYGQDLPRDDWQIAGIHLLDTESALNSLGTADKVTNKKGMISKTQYYYGGITYNVDWDGRISYINVTNRDAVTNRGIAVGDSLVKVYEAYGAPTNITKDDTWVYGYYKYATDRGKTLEFSTKNKKVTNIRMIIS